MSNIVLAAGSEDGYQISRSLRFRNSASASLTRVANSGNQKTFTLSFWMKRGALVDRDIISSKLTGGSYPAFSIGFDTDRLRIWDYTGAAFNVNLYTNAVYRDPSAWYHVVVAVDTTQATAANRVKLYVNGSQVTTFSTATYPSQNTDLNWNLAGVTNTIGGQSAGGYGYFDGYLAEINSVSGSYLDPSSFGENDLITGVWKPKKYAGTYGTNGFYLNFSDNSAATAAAIGKDSSGNGNNWTPNNISVTAGTTYDSMTDVPTLTSATAANYCVLNSISPLASGTLSNANLTFTSGVADAICVGTFGVSSGKWYWEVTATTVNGSGSAIGIIGQPPASLTVDLRTPSNGYCYMSAGTKGNNNSAVAYGASYTSGDVIGVALDMDAGTLVFYKNNASQGTAYSSLSGTFSPAISDLAGAQSGAVFDCNFGQRPFTYTPPTGFKALCTQNLSTPNITNGAKYFAATTYTGNGTSVSVNNGANNPIGVTFQPDFVWLKDRSAALAHQLFDTVRGAGYRVLSNGTNAETYDITSLSSFNSNGFSVGSNSGINTNGDAIIGWQWKAGGTAVSNTTGSITSSVSANPTAGFSVVTWAGNSTNASTIGHGLGVAPSMIITKSRTNLSSWVVGIGGISGFGVNDYLTMQTTSAKGSSSTFYQAYGSSTFTVGVSAADEMNKTGNNYVSYCFAAVPGYSAFGSYTGNGSADGAFVYLGFRPRFVMFKNASSAGNNWLMFDSSRDVYNLTQNKVAANASNAENDVAISSSSENTIDFLSNGFKCRTSNAQNNGSGSTIIYAAFAENPFKYSLAR